MTLRNKFPSIHLSLLRLKDEVTDACREIGSQSTWRSFSDVVAKLTDTQDRLKNWQRNAQALFPSLDIQARNIDGLKPLELLLKSEYLSIVELLHRPWLYIWLHSEPSQRLGELSTQPTMDRIMISALIAQSVGMIKVHRSAVLMCMNLELSLLDSHSSFLICNQQVISAQLFVYTLLILSSSLRKSSTVEFLDHLECQAALQAVHNRFKSDNATANQKDYLTILEQLDQDQFGAS